MISIVTAYYNRKKLFIRTLESIAKSSLIEEVEVIAVDDGSREEERLEDLVSIFPFLKVKRLEPENKWYSNSCIPFNIGFKLAKGDKIIIQNPECLHHNDIIKYTSENLGSNEYLSFGCYSLDKYTTDNLDEILIQKNKLTNIVQQGPLNTKSDGDLGWYNHSLHRPVAYHFCTAITKDKLNYLGGFDERLSLGIAYDDDDLLKRVKGVLEVVFVDNHIVLHQNHYSSKSTSYQNRLNKYNLIAKNKFVLNNRINLFSEYRANLISKHLSFSSKKYWFLFFLKIEEVYFKGILKLRNIFFLKKK